MGDVIYLRGEHLGEISDRRLAALFIYAGAQTVLKRAQAGDPHTKRYQLIEDEVRRRKLSIDAIMRDWCAGRLKDAEGKTYQDFDRAWARVR